MIRNTENREPMAPDIVPRLGRDASADRVLARIGCAEDSRPGARVLREVQRAIAAVEACSLPVAEVRSYPVHGSRRRTLVDNRIVLESPKLVRVLAPCQRAIVFVITLGQEVDRLVQAALDRRPHLGVVLDAAASMAAERQADRLTEDLGKRLAPGLALTLRYSPGYCDWPLSDQSKLFALLPDRPAGVTLSGHFLMSPRKSVSGIIGVGPELDVRASGCACHRCGRRDCEDRRA